MTRPLGFSAVPLVWLRVPFSFAAPGMRDLVPVRAGQVVQIVLYLLIPFDQPSVRMAVGTADHPEILLAARDINPRVTGPYGISGVDFGVTESTTLQFGLDVGDSTQGSGFLSIRVYG